LASSEDLLISAVVRGAGVRTAAKLGVTADLFLRRKGEWEWLNEHKAASKATFKARFPNFKVYTVDPEEIDVIAAQAIRTRADYDLGKMFERMQRKLGRVEPIDLATELESEVRGIMRQYSRGEDVDIFDNWKMSYNHVKKAHDAVTSGGSIGFPFGIPTLDKLTGGMQAPDLITIVARQGEFKTWMSLFFAANAAIGGGKVLYASLEMSPEQVALRVQTLMNRMLAKTYADQFKDHFTNMGLMMGAVDLDEYRQFLLRARKRLRKGFIVSNAQGGFNMSSMVAQCEKHHPDIAFFDYFGLGVGTDMTRGGENWVQAVQTSRMAKHSIARAFDIPFVLNAQANRASADSSDAPELHQISLTDALGADSDRVLALRLKGGELKMTVRKNRLGRTGDTIKFETDIDRGIIDEIQTARKRHRTEDDED
jgi:replicative DNA helicase